jgi:putative hemolysin
MAESWISLFGLILFSGLISLAEFATAASKRAKLEPLLKKGSSSARFVLENLGRQSTLHKSLQLLILILLFICGMICLDLVRAISSSRSIESFNNLSDGAYFLASIFLFTAPLLFLIQLITVVVPQRIASIRPESIAVFMSPFSRFLHRIMFPFVWITGFFSNTIFRIIGLPESNGEKPVTEEEVIEMIAQGTSSGTIEEVEQDMLERVLLLGDRSVASLMTNRIEVEWIDVRDSFEVVLKKITESNHSLFPVCDDELDKVVGILNSKKFLVAAQKEKTTTLRSLIEPARIIPENMKALSALDEFKASKAKIAVVVDEYGAVQGLLTQSDLFESIVAEHDLPDEENETSIIQRNENSFLIDALLPFEEFLQYFEIDDVAPEDRTGFHSLGGFILHLSRQIPVTGDRFHWKNFELEVVDMDGNRIDKILLTIQELKED